MNTAGKVSLVIAALIGIGAAGVAIDDYEQKKKCAAAGGTWNGLFRGCSISTPPPPTCPQGQVYDSATGQCVAASTSLATPTNFKITVPESATSPTVQCIASWDPVEDMISGDYYSLVITANGSPLVNQQIPMGTTSYQFNAPAGAALSGSVSACMP